MTDLTAAVESVEQLSTVWRAMVRDRDEESDVVRDLPGVVVRWADCRFAFWNAVTLTHVGADAALLEQRLGQAADIMRAKKRPGFLWLFEALLADDARAALGEAAQRAGLAYAFAGTGMAGDLLPIPQPHHPDLTFERVTTDEQLRTYADINSRAYGFPLEEGRDGIAGSALWKNEAYAYLALRDGVPVAYAATVEARDRLFVVLVATDPDAQRRGYGEAVMRKALLPTTPDSVVLITSHSRRPQLVRTWDAEPFEVVPLDAMAGRKLLVSVGRIGGDAADNEAVA